MDGGGRLAEPVAQAGHLRPSGASTASIRQVRPRSRVRRRFPRTRYRKLLWLNRHLSKLDAFDPPRGTGVAATVLILLASMTYGTIQGGHLPVVIDNFKHGRDVLARQAGFQIAGIALSGQKHLTRDEILSLAGVTENSSLLFFDVTEARARLMTNPWIADATVQKLYPDKLQISVSERKAFALWQKEKRIGVIAADGTLLQSELSQEFAGFPMFVGLGAEKRAKNFAALLDHYPDIRAQVHAAVFVAERRWNLRLKNGIDIRLPESGIARALDELVALDRDKNLISRDIVAIDLRLPDRVTVQLSDTAAATRQEWLKSRKPQPKGGNA